MTLDWPAAFTVALVSGILLTIGYVGRRQYRAVAARLPVPAPPPSPDAAGVLPRVHVEMHLPAVVRRTGGYGHTVALEPRGILVRGPWLLSGSTSFWVPWDLVASCAHAANVAPDSDNSMPGAIVTLGDGLGTVMIGDPAGTMVLDYWRGRGARGGAAAPTSR